MNDKDYIKELFSERLGQAETPVRPELWNSIESQLGSASAAGASASVKGVSVATKWLIGSASALVIGVGSYAFFSTEVATKEKQGALMEENRTIEPTASVSAATQVDTKFTSGSSKATIRTQRTSTSIALDQTETAAYRTTGDAQEETYKPLIVKERSAAGVSDATGGASDSRSDATDKKGNQVKDQTNGGSSGSSSVDPNRVGSMKTNISGDLANVITPNGDGINDYLFVNTRNIVDFSITILNNRNQVVYKSEDPEFRFYPQDLPDGDYYYIIVAKDANGTPMNDFQLLKIKRQ